MTDLFAEYKALKSKCGADLESQKFIDGLAGLQQRAREEGQLAWVAFLEARKADAERKSDAAIGLYGRLVDEFSRSAESSDRILVSWALVNKGAVLGERNMHAEALVAFDEVVRRFGEATEPELKIFLAQALVNKGVALVKLEKWGEAIVACDDLARRFGEATELGLKIQVAKALYSKVVALRQQGKWEAEVAAYDDAVSQFGEATEIELKIQVAEALVNKGITLGLHDKPADAVATFDEVARRFGEASQPQLKIQVARALVSKGAALGKQEKWEEATLACDEVLRRWGEATESELKTQVATALFNKGITLGKQEKWEDAVIAFDQLLRRFADATEPELKIQVAEALVDKGIATGRQKKWEEAALAFDEVVHRFGEAAEPELKVQVAKALFNKGVGLLEQGKWAEAISPHDELIRRFGEATEPKIKILVAKALFNKAFALGESGELGEAIAVVNEWLAQFGQINEPELSPAVDRAQFYLSRLFAQNKEDQKAIAAFRKVVDRDPSGEAIRGWVAFLSKQKDGGVLRYLACDERLRRHFGPGEYQRFKSKITEGLAHTRRFLSASSDFHAGPSSPALFFDLREWNSFTPAVPDRHAAHRGGGYFIRYAGHGIVIDPGFNFVQNLEAVGGRIHDIHHVVVTHAHNDHTQDFETILSLVAKYNEENKADKRVHLYLNHSAARKFSGFLDLRRMPGVGVIEVLNPGRPERPQVIALHGLPGAELTVLPAYHQDMVSLEYAVGVGIKFQFGQESRTVVFTGDTGLFATKWKYKDGKFEADGIDFDRPVFKCYPAEFVAPDFLVAHLGSVKEYELELIESFTLEEPAQGGREKRFAFYPNHLGLRGLFIYLTEIRPRIAIVGEFGEETREIRFSIARGIEALLKEADIGVEKVVPGDLTVVYDIENGAFLCHEDCRFHPVGEVFVVAVKDSDNPNNVFFSPDTERTYFFLQEKPDEGTQAVCVDGFYSKMAHRRLPYFSRRP